MSCSSIIDTGALTHRVLAFQSAVTDVSAGGGGVSGGAPRALVRVLGAFRSVDRARAWVKANFPSPERDTYLAHTDRFVTVCADRKNQSDVQYCDAARERILRHWSPEMVDERQRRLESDVKDRIKGGQPTDQPGQGEGAQDEANQEMRLEDEDEDEHKDTSCIPSPVATAQDACLCELLSAPGERDLILRVHYVGTSKECTEELTKLAKDGGLPYDFAVIQTGVFVDPQQRAPLRCVSYSDKQLNFAMQLANAGNASEAARIRSMYRTYVKTRNER